MFVSSPHLYCIQQNCPLKANNFIKYIVKDKVLFLETDPFTDHDQERSASSWPACAILFSWPGGGPQEAWTWGCRGRRGRPATPLTPVSAAPLSTCDSENGKLFENLCFHEIFTEINPCLLLSTFLLRLACIIQDFQKLRCVPEKFTFWILMCLNAPTNQHFFPNKYTPDEPCLTWPYTPSLVLVYLWPPG